MSERLEWKIKEDSPDWECDWESSRRFQLRYWAALPLRRKLAAIEEMGELAKKFQAMRKGS
jgi:hypothetical protein